MAFTLPALPYATDALEPHIDKLTMEIHHGKHHQAYVTNLNKALEGKPEADAHIEDIIKNISKYPMAVRNNGGGHYNHSLFWTLLSPSGGGEPKGELADAINSTFGSFADFKTKMQDAGATRFGSGWAWLIVGADKKLAVTSTPNQDNPLMDIAEVKGTPILGIDVWEHAYYLKYQNRRPDYLAAIWNVINWNHVAELYAAAK
ncbi:MAG: superoxide dismutase [Mucilaginibacter sp.]|uniref:superoxide dismutase n=1 Tax=Mucilaginibacter sp. L3T2-6 TaxID=3062491 RepID=UPI0026757203|nr:superoxide dismutase [Mucilaginibacter sp. L3T2-6]MDO3643957.1 superoxide dismutase [Mucilaginibacter sp. L3T2-6]MDV6216320.1 superoxide dismutase [Mucilaginibacter sp. L3T2-6]